MRCEHIGLRLCFQFALSPAGFRADWFDIDRPGTNRFNTPAALHPLAGRFRTDNFNTDEQAHDGLANNK
jgi:hypothetical protein